MIGYLRGELAEFDDEGAIVDVSGVGYKVYLSLRDIELLPSTGNLVKIYTYMYIREDIIALYGFLNSDELKIFKALISISGVGPKAALSIFSSLSANDLKFAILSDDSSAISKAQGIGKKTAQKIILELKDKFTLDDTFEERFEDKASSIKFTDEKSIALEALISLGYSAPEAKKSVESVKTEGSTVEEIIKEALKYLI